MLLHSQVIIIIIIIIILQEHDIPFSCSQQQHLVPTANFTSFQLTLLISQNYIIFLYFLTLIFALPVKHLCSYGILPMWDSFVTTSNCRHCLSTHSAAILPELRPPNFPNELTLDNPLKLLLPLSFTFLNFFDVLLNLEQFISTLSRSVSSWYSVFTTTSLAMVLRQNGQTGGVRQAVAGLGLLWQHRASVHCAHIWWPQLWTSIVHACSKQMQHNSDSLTCKISHDQWVDIYITHHGDTSLYLDSIIILYINNIIHFAYISII